MEAKLLFEDRELSWLKFNERVLGESSRNDVPFCERLLFFHIFQTNLDEFFKVRVGSIVDRMDFCDELKSQLTVIRAKVQELNRSRTAIWHELVSELSRQNVFLKEMNDWTKEDKHAAAKAFAEQLEPMVSTLIIGKHRTVPFIRDKQTYMALRMVKKTVAIIASGLGWWRAIRR